MTAPGRSPRSSLIRASWYAARSSTPSTCASLAWSCAAVNRLDRLVDLAARARSSSPSVTRASASTHGAPTARAASRACLRHGGRGFLVPGVHEGLGAGWPAPGPAPRRAGPRQRVDGRLGGLHRVGDRRQSPAGSRLSRSRDPAGERRVAGIAEPGRAAAAARAPRGATSPLAAALVAERNASMPRSILASFSGSLTRSHSASACVEMPVRLGRARPAVPPPAPPAPRR